VTVREQLTFRVAILTALDAALTRRVEVMEVLWAAEDDEAALTGIRRLLGCDELGAQAVLDLSWRRLTSSGRERIARELAERKAELAEG
jgi:DNA gyrase/topoisomerase IV subunit A